MFIEYAWRAAGLLILLAAPGYPQSEPAQVSAILQEEIVSPKVTVFQLRQYLLTRVAKPPSPSNAETWTAESKRLREHLLSDVVYHGWPRQWVDAPPRFEEVGVLEGNGYRIRKLRYEIVPGFYSVALLYEPITLRGKIPAVLNVNGHVGAPGKAVEYKQKRCITLARNGILALNLEWFSCGELNRKGNEHSFGAHLDLVGTHELGLFYLAMRKGLDYLYEHPNTDRSRLAMTGLSGGGWQTITLSSLDERVRTAVPVAGFSSTATRVEANRYGDVGDIEQSGADFFADIDYPHLVGLMAPRPTMLIYNAEDDCCFRAPMSKPLVFDALQPVFRLYGKEDAFSWHENRDPGTHNYQLDNRLQAYKFLSRQFNLPSVEDEGPVAPEIRSYDELLVGLPKDNLTILDLARKLAAEISRPPAPASPAEQDAARARLKTVIRYRPVAIDRVWKVGISKNTGVETSSHIFSMANGLSANAVLLKGIGVPSTAPVSVVLNDKGKAASIEEVSDRVNRGEQVLALDLAFVGGAWAEGDAWEYEQILYGLGDRPLGIEVAQLLQIGNWIRRSAGVEKVRLEAKGIRSQVTALIAASLEPGLFSEITVRGGMRSMDYILRKPMEFGEAPDLFCLDLFKETDIDRLTALAAPARVRPLSPVD